MNIDAIMAELAQYIRMQEEAAAMVESLKDQLKERMTAAGVESLAGADMIARALTEDEQTERENAAYLAGGTRGCRS